MKTYIILMTIALLTGLFLAEAQAAVATSHETLGCTYCHTDNIGLGAQRAVICLSCHGPGGSSSLRAVAHADLDCKDCHVSMGGRDNWLGGVNLKFLRAEVDKTGQHSDETLFYGSDIDFTIKTPLENHAQVVFESRGSTIGEPTLHAFADGDQDRNGVYDGICEVCHLDFLYQNPSFSSHHLGETCTECHLHSNGFR